MDQIKIERLEALLLSKAIGGWTIESYINSGKSADIFNLLIIESNNRVRKRVPNFPNSVKICSFLFVDYPHRVPQDNLC